MTTRVSPTTSPAPGPRSRGSTIGGGSKGGTSRTTPDDPYPRAEVRRLPDLTWGGEDAPRLAETEGTVRRALAVMSEYRQQVWSADVELSDDPVTRSWQLASIAPVGALDHLALLRSSSIAGLLESTARLTSEALEQLPLQSPDETDRRPGVEV